jgi:two-component system LytT family response regulator
MKIRTLIVDDEPLARERLSELLRSESEIEIVGECANGREALTAIEAESPDLLFLDIQMPELDGFGVVAELSPTKMPVIIFVTAYDKFALRAFEVHALDYLLKPFDRERFQKALQRAIGVIKQNDREELGQRLAALMAEIKPETKALERLAIKIDGRVLLIKVEEIDWIEAADNYVNLHVGQESHLHRETLSGLEAKLPRENFLRINRSTIVNIERVKELQPMFHGDYVVILRNGTKLSLSRGYRENLNLLLGKTM